MNHFDETEKYREPHNRHLYVPLPPPCCTNRFRQIHTIYGNRLLLLQTVPLHSSLQKKCRTAVSTNPLLGLPDSTYEEQKDRPRSTAQYPQDIRPADLLNL